MDEIKVCKECWSDIDLGKKKKYTFTLSDHIKLSSHQKDYATSDYLCSEYCLEQWKSNELEGCIKEIK